MEELIKRLEGLKVDMSMPGDIDEWYYSRYIKAIDDALNLVRNNGVLPIVSITLPGCKNCGKNMTIAAYECKCGVVKEA